MKHINLIAFIDGSAHTPVLCEYAAQLAMKSNASIKLYHVLESHTVTDKNDLSGAINLGARTKLMDELVREGEKKSKAALVKGRKVIEDAKKRLEELGCINIEMRLRTGEIEVSLKNKESGGDLILIGKRGKKNSETKSRLGYNFERIVRASTKPVFVSNSICKEINHVLVAYDGSLPSIRILKYLLGQSAFGELAVSILVVSKVAKDRLGQEQKSFIMSLNQRNRSLNFIDATGDPKDQIIERLRNQQYDMLAIGAYGHSKLRQLFIGSTTSALIHASPVPVLLSK